MKKAIIKIIDEMHVVLIGLEPHDYTYFFEKYGLYAKGYFFHPLVKLGRWDGKVRYFSKGGKTYFHLLTEIIPDLKSKGYKLELIDNRKYFEFTVPQIYNTYCTQFVKDGKSIVLGDHQVKAINVLTANNGGIVVAATGSGKSIIISTIVELYQKHDNLKSIIIVPAKDLVVQFREDMKPFNLDVGVYYGDEKDVNHQHLISTWQSLKNNKSLVALYDIIIVDECHGSAAAVLKDILLTDGINAKIKIGVTGTLPKEPTEFMDVRITLGNKLYEIPARELMDSGWLAKLKLKIYQLIENLNPEWESFKIENPEKAATLTYKDFKTEFLPDFVSEQKFIKARPKRNDFIVNLIETARMTTGNCFVFINGVDYGKKLSKMIENSYFLYNKDDTEVRKEVYNLFAEHDDIVVIVNTKLASTGLNIPRIFNIFLIDQSKSFISTIQAIGRGTRKADDKDSFNVYDICSDLHYAKEHLAKRKKYYKEQNYNFEIKKIEYDNG